MPTAIPSRRTLPSDVALDRDARDLARVLYGADLLALSRRGSHPARAHIAWLLCGRGWTQRAVSRALGYADHSTLSYHLKRANAAFSAGRWPFWDGYNDAEG